jgi:hypothetical protein
MAATSLDVPVEVQKAPSNGKIPHPPQFKLRLEFITPKRAADDLAKRNTNNRTLSEDTSDAYARDIEGGRWLDVPVCIIYSKAGIILDGQHRLAGIVKANRGRWCLVAYDIPDEASQVIDLGRPRNVSDQRRIVFGDKSAKRRVAIATSIARLVTNDRIGRLTPSEHNHIMQENRTALAWAMSKPCPARFTAPVWGALAFAYAVEPAAVDAFADSLIKAEGAVAAAVNRAIMSHKSGSPADRMNLSLTIIGAVKRHAKGESCMLVKANPEATDRIREKRLKVGMDKWAERFKA